MGKKTEYYEFGGRFNGFVGKQRFDINPGKRIEVNTSFSKPSHAELIEAVEKALNVTKEIAATIVRSVNNFKKV